MELTDCFYGNQDTPIAITSTLSPWPQWQLVETGQMSIHVSVFVRRMSPRTGRERKWRHSMLSRLLSFFSRSSERRVWLWSHCFHLWTQQAVLSFCCGVHWINELRDVISDQTCPQRTESIRTNWRPTEQRKELFWFTFCSWVTISHPEAGGIWFSHPCCRAHNWVTAKQLLGPDRTMMQTYTKLNHKNWRVKNNNFSVTQCENPSICSRTYQNMVKMYLCISITYELGMFFSLVSCQILIRTNVWTWKKCHFYLDIKFLINQ